MSSSTIQLIDALHALRMRLVQRCVEATLHHVNNTLGVSNSYLELHLMTKAQAQSAQHDLTQVSARLRQISELNNKLVRQLRVLQQISPASPTVSHRAETTLRPFDERHEAHLAMLQTLAKHSHISLHFETTFDALETPLPAPLSDALEALFLLLVTLTPNSATITIDLKTTARGETTYLTERELALSTIAPLDEDRRDEILLAIHVSPLDVDAILQATQRHPIHQLCQHILRITPGALYLHPLSKSLTLLVAPLPPALDARDEPFATADDMHAEPEGAAPGTLRDAKDEPERLLQCLIIDDEQAMINPLKRILKYQGFQVTAFTDPTEALTMDASLFDITLVDYSMNEINGLQTLYRLREMHPTLPAIMITGMPDAALLESLRNDPLTRILTKPWSIPQLLHLIRQVLPSR